MQKRVVGLVFLALVLALVAGTILVLRTSWAGERLCAEAASRLTAATGAQVRVGACRIEPLRLSIELTGLEVGPVGAPLFAAEHVSARLAAVQTLSRQLHLATLRLTRPRLRVAFPAGATRSSPKAGACPPADLRRFEVRRLEVDDGAVDLSWSDGDFLKLGRIDVHTKPASGKLRELAAPLRREHVEAAVTGLKGLLGGHDLLGSVAFVGDVSLDLSRAEVESLNVDLDGLNVLAHGKVSNLCDPRLDLEARGHGDLAGLFRALGLKLDIEGRAEAVGRVVGPLTSPIVEANASFERARVGPFTAGSGRADLRVDDKEVVLDHFFLGIGAGSARGRVSFGLQENVPLVGDADLLDLDLADLLDRFGVHGAFVSTRLDGRAHLAGPLLPPLVTGTISVEVKDFRALDRSYSVAEADPGIVAFKRGHLETPIRIDGSGLYFEKANLEVGRGKLSADARVYFDEARGFALALRGDADLDALGRVAQVPWRGMASVEIEGGAAPYGKPQLSGHARVQGFRFLDLDLGDVSADIRYEDYLLRLSGVEGVRGRTRFTGEGVVDLARSPPHVVSARYEATGRLRDLFEGAMGYLPAAKSVRDVWDGDVEVTGTATGPSPELAAEFEARLGAGRLAGRPYDSGHMVGRVHDGREVRIDSAELNRGKGRIEVAGTWGFEPPYPWDLSGSFAGWSLSDLDLPIGGWTGTGSGTAKLKGSLLDPQVHIAASASPASVAGVSLGTVQAGATVTGRRLVFSGTADAVQFEGHADLSGKMPFEAHAVLSLDDASRLFPEVSGTPVRATVHGEATAEGSLTEIEKAHGEVHLDTLKAAWADFHVQAEAPAVLHLGEGKIELAPLTLRGTNTSLVLSGRRLPGGDLEANASGVVDLRLLGALLPSLRRPFGRLKLEAHVGGTLSAPVLVGSGRVEDAGLTLKAAGLSLSSLRGDLAFSQNRVLFDGLRASLNGGEVRLEGEVGLQKLSPAQIRVRADLIEVPLAVPTYLPATLSGRVEASGTPEATTVSGRLHVVRARYTGNAGLSSSLLELGARPAPPPRAYDKSGDWLHLEVQLVADGDDRVESEAVRGAVHGEVVVTGTLAAPGLLGTLAMAEGSRAVFRGNEFDLSHAVLEFTDRNKIDGQLDVHGESQVRDYQVFMHVFGTLSEPQVSLTSSPALSQPDIITLLSLGYTRRDAGAGDATSAMATAAAAQALVSASGLDEQVRRFVPRGGLMRDFSVRITSSYSDLTGQVAPRAEFESWLLRDKLRLRYQAPIGASRGQRAQAEVRLSPHTSVQYQWENDNPDVVTGDHGLDLKLRWEWTDR